jgi:hypothetical protein
MRGRRGFSCRLKPASFELNMPFLSQARRLGGLHRASPLPFRDIYFASGLHPPDVTAQRLIAYLYKRWSYISSSFTHSIFALRSFPPVGPSWQSELVRLLGSCSGQRKEVDHPTKLQAILIVSPNRVSLPFSKAFVSDATPNLPHTQPCVRG